MTFDFVIDCFPAYTAFSKSKKVLAQLNVIDPDADVHNYNDPAIHGHKGRKSDSDINKYWGNSIFDTTTTADGGGAQIVSAAEGDEPSTPSTPSESETTSPPSVVEDNTPAEPIEENTSVEPGAEESE